MSSTQQLLLGEGAAGGGYQIERSLRFNSADSAYLNRTPSSAGNRKTWTWSGWVKRGLLGASGYYTMFGAGTTSPTYDGFRFGADSLQFYQAGAASVNIVTTSVYRDASAWYHVILAVDTTQATASNRVKIYVNGTQVTAFSTASYPAQNAEASINNTVTQVVGGTWTTSVQSPYDGYMAEINFIDGQALDPTSFGLYDPETGVWSPKKYTGTYGTNGFYLNFADNSGTTSTTLGKDSSGNGNNWTPNNFSVTAGAGNDSLVDTPTPYGTDTGVGGEVRGNYATLNPLGGYLTGGPTLTNGNLDYGQGASSWNSCGSTFQPNTGKWYFETSGSVGTAQYIAAGLRAVGNIGSGEYAGSTSGSYGAAQSNASLTAYSGGSAGSNISGTFTSSTPIQVAVDFDAGKIWIGSLNGTWIGGGNPATGSTPTYTFTANTQLIPYVSGYALTAVTNFGQRPFAYTAPSGFKALCTQNLPEPTIADGGDYFNTVLYTGDGTGNKAITGVGFQPDFVWVKSRSNAANHGLHDVLRVISGNEEILYSNLTDAGNTGGSYLSSFDSNGFTVNSNASGNGSGQTYVAWNWKANGAGSSNTAGTITSTVSANTTSGFSIVTYTGTGANATVGHGLGVAPSMVIVKARNLPNSIARPWAVWHTALSATEVIFLNDTAAKSTGATTYWNSTLPTSSVFSLGNEPVVNGATGTVGIYVAYCFAAVAGYSAFGSYTGNGSADGPFVFTNHRPAFLLIKRTDTTSNWTILDLAREGYNVDNDPLYPNLPDAEGTTDLADILSNGFKLRSTDASVNANTGTYIYMSLASNPFKYSLAR